VTQDKATALLYQKYLDEFGMISSDVLISGPDDREGNEEVDEENLPAVQQFWKKMMARHGSEKQYNKNLINGFKSGDDLEIIIVVDKLLTGFDAPRNTVLYLTRQLQDHTLLQAIARVNRLCDGKDFGYIIDYRGVLQNLNQAFDLYGKMEEYDQADLEATLTDVAEKIGKLPRRHTDLLNLFQSSRTSRTRNSTNGNWPTRRSASGSTSACGISAARSPSPSLRPGSWNRRLMPGSRSTARTWRSSCGCGRRSVGAMPKSWFHGKSRRRGDGH